MHVRVVDILITRDKRVGAKSGRGNTQLGEAVKKGKLIGGEDWAPVTGERKDA